MILFYFTFSSGVNSLLPCSNSREADDCFPDISILSMATTSTPTDKKDFLWTPGETSNYESSEDDSSDAVQINRDEDYRSELDTLNEALHRLSGGTFSPLTFQLNCSWSAASVEDKEVCLEKAEEACKIICNIISPLDGQSLFQSLLDNQGESVISKDLEALMTAFANPPNRRLKFKG